MNNNKVNFSKLGDDIRITRFIRDPRDLVVSGYHYHKKGAEDWCNIVDPTEQDWKVVNGFVPEGIKEGQSYAQYLRSISTEEGLMAEIEFRANHFRSMMEWPESDDRVKLFRYRNIMGNEPDVYAEVFSHYDVTWPETKIGVWLADRFSAKKRKSRSDHIRNPNSLNNGRSTSRQR